MKRMIMLAVVLAMAGGIADAKSCKDAKGKFIKCPTAAASSAPAMSSMASASVIPGKKAPNCVKGKLCGNTCISVKDTCHK